MCRYFGQSKCSKPMFREAESPPKAVAAAPPKESHKKKVSIVEETTDSFDSKSYPSVNH